MVDLPAAHAAALENIRKQVRWFFLQKKKVKIYHGSTNSTRPQYYEKDRVVDVSALNRVIAVNAEEKYVLVEPNVPMDELVEATLPYGLVPPVVMEFPGITVGGGIQGGAAESSSFKYGLFHNTCLEYEIVLGNGDVVTASPRKRADLFWGTACSYGSLGIITLVKLRLVPAKPFVHLTYHRVRSFDEAVRLTEKKTNGTAGFIDAIIFAKDRGVVMVGNFSEKKPLPIATFSKANDDWFYLHAEKALKAHDHYEELIPVKDYLFRYDRGGFWVGRHGFKALHLPFNQFWRFFLNSALKTRELYRFFHTPLFYQKYFFNFFVQDLSIPQETALKFLQFVDNKLHIYPLWLCPLLPGRQDKLSPGYLKTKLVINIGVWGKTNYDYPGFVQTNREVENEVKKLGGRKVLYAHAYYPRNEFWKIYNSAWYAALRKKYSAETVFPDIYEKTLVSGKPKSSVPKGLWSTLVKSPFKTPATVR